MRPEIRRLTTEQFLSLLASVHPNLSRRITAVHLHHTWRPNRAQFRGLASIEAMRQLPHRPGLGRHRASISPSIPSASRGPAETGTCRRPVRRGRTGRPTPDRS